MHDITSKTIRICATITIEISAPEELFEELSSSSELQRILPHTQFINGNAKPDFILQIVQHETPHTVYNKESKILIVYCPPAEITVVSFIWLLHYIMRTIIKYHDALFVHCSCLKIDAHSCILLAGKSGAGKSTLSLHLARKGFQIVGTDLTLVNAQNKVLFGSLHINLYPDVLAKYFNDLFHEFVGNQNLDKSTKIELPISRMIQKGYYADTDELLNIKSVFIVQSADKELTRQENYYYKKIEGPELFTHSLAIDDNAQWSDWIEAKWLISYPYLENSETLKTTEKVMKNLSHIPHYAIYGDFEYVTDKIIDTCNN